MAKQIATRKQEKGQSLIELAVGLLVLLILLAGVVDLGRLAFFYMSMRDAAEEGVVYGSVYPTHCTQIEDYVMNSVADARGATIQVTMNGKPCGQATKADACAGKEIIVTLIKDDFPITMPFLGSFLGGQRIPLRATIKGTILRPGCS